MEKAKSSETGKTVYIVGYSGPEENVIGSVHRTYAGALKTWNELRLELLSQAKHMLAWSKKEAKERLKKGEWGFKMGNTEGKFTPEDIKYFEKIAKFGDEMYLEMIKKLSETDPKKIDNYPHETPYIEEWKIKR